MNWIVLCALGDRIEILKPERSLTCRGGGSFSPSLDKDLGAEDRISRCSDDDCQSVKKKCPIVVLFFKGRCFFCFFYCMSLSGIFHKTFLRMKIQKK